MFEKKPDKLLWKDVSGTNFFKNKLDRFSEVLHISSIEHELPFFLFTINIDNVYKAVEELNALNNVKDRQIIVIYGYGDKHHREIWNNLSNKVFDVMEWTDQDDLIDYVHSLAQKKKRIDEVLNSTLVSDNLIGESEVWKGFLRNVIEAAIFSTATVLLIGESGTGKELISRLIHTVDGRNNKKDIVLLDCATIVSDLSGSEFFGHEKGSYTNAIQSREGAFSVANQGTLFLDEIGELPLRMQAELLRVIQEKTFKKIGSNSWQTTDFRLVCATNKDLKCMIKDAGFRHDLYFRISDFEFRVPSLTERVEDIPLLANHFLKEFITDQKNLEFEDPVMEWLVKRDYAGNVRELRQLIRRIALKHIRHKKITIGEIPLQDRYSVKGSNSEVSLPTLRSSLRKAILSGYNLCDLKNMTMEEAIQISLDLCNGNKEKAARKLGVTWRAILQFRKKNKVL